MNKHNSITGHIVVKNEDQFIWYAIKSVLPYVDRLLIADTGSTDLTLKIISLIKSNKIDFSQIPTFTASDIATIRQKQITRTKSDWVWIIDGDEIYPQSLCQEIVDIISSKGNYLEGIVVKRTDLLGDIYHYQHDSVGSYDIFAKSGHIVLRLINKKNIPNLHVTGIYPYEGYYDKEGREIISHTAEKFAFTKGSLFHAMYLKRSSLGANLTDTFHRRKWKVESGLPMPKDTIYPEVFFLKKPSLVPNVTTKRNLNYEIKAAFITPIKTIKRKIIGE